MKEKTTHGGKRPGAGRKPLPEAERRIKKCFYIKPDVVSLLKKHAENPTPLSQAKLIERAIRRLFNKKYNK